MVVASAFFFTLTNSYLNAKYAIFKEHGGSLLERLATLLGICIFAQGLAINIWSDHILLNLRKPGDKSYHIPYGPPFRIVSCPNYLGEITEFCGLFLAFRTASNASFVITTVCNLVPRAMSTHQWYKTKFGSKYPPERFAIVPFVL